MCSSHVEVKRGETARYRVWMSRYELPGKERRYRIIVGWDTTLPRRVGDLPGTLYAQVEDSGVSAAIDVDAESEVGDTPEEGLILWIGQGIDDWIVDVQTIVKATAPYGDIPLVIQVALVRDMDRDWPRSWSTIGSALTAIIQQSSMARLASESEPGGSYYILLNEQGWQLREWSSLLVQGNDYERTFATMVLTSESMKASYSYTEPLASYVSDPRIILRIHPDGLTLGLPVFAALTRGVMLPGPVVIAGEDRGLSNVQVQLIAQEVLFVEESIRKDITLLWSHLWSTIGSRRSKTQG